MSEQFGCNTTAVNETKNQLFTVVEGLEALADPVGYQTEVGSAIVGTALDEFVSESSDIRGKILSGTRGLHSVFEGLLNGIASVDAQLASAFADPSPPPPAPSTEPDPTAVFPPLWVMKSDSIAAWWTGLTEPQRQYVITQHPEWIANRDGIPFASRDAANRVRIPLEEAKLRERQQQLQQDIDTMKKTLPLQHDGFWENVFDIPGPEDAVTLYTIHEAENEFNEVNGKVASLEAVKTMLTNPDRHVIGLDFSQGRTQAIISNGDVDTADHVAVLVPGVGTTVDEDIQGKDAEMARLKGRTEQILRNRQQPGTVATVTWLGYQAPQPDTILTSNSFLGSGPAQDGGQSLAEFLRGINDMRQPDPHLTLLGHSYGSTSSGYALSEDTGVDEAVLFGSPGLPVDDALMLRVPSGHVFVADAPGDWIADTGWFGPDPENLPNAKQLSVSESYVDWGPESGMEYNSSSEGHSEYLKDKSTSQYNLSQVIAGNTSSLFERK